MNAQNYRGINAHSQRTLLDALRDPNYNPVVVLGDGQIAMMYVQECRRRKIPVIVIGDGTYASKNIYSPSEQALGSNDYYINAGKDYANLNQPEISALVEKLKVTGSSVSAEFENVPVSVLDFFENQEVRLTPGKKAFAICRNKLHEKQYFQSQNILTTDFLELTNLDNQKEAIGNFLPGFVKIQELGYDGKGQVEVKTFDEVKSLLSIKPEGSTDANAGKFYDTLCILEKKIDIKYEMSVVLLRGKDGEIIIGAVPKNFQDEGILVASAISEEIIPQSVKDQAIDYAIKAAHGMDYEGLLVVEFFVGRNDTVRVNEMAPRPHNSGHHTIEARYTSQYALQGLLSQGPQTVKSIMDAYKINGIQSYDKGSYRELVPRHPHVGLINVLGTTTKGVAEGLEIPSFGPNGQIPNIDLSVKHMLYYGKPDGKDTKRGHIVISARNQEELIQKMSEGVYHFHPNKSPLPW